MKNKWIRAVPGIFLWTMITVLGVSFSAHAASQCPDGLSAYWKLDESAGPYLNSASATGDTDGICSACPSSISGLSGTGQKFDGATSISIPANASFNWSADTSFSIELWMNRDSSNPINTSEIMIGREEDSATGLKWYLGIDANGYAVAFFRDTNGSIIYQHVSTKKISYNSQEPQEPQKPTWHHIVFVRDGQNNRNTLYVDAFEDSATSADSSGFESGTAELTIGNLASENAFSGSLDEIAVYQRALTKKEVNSHYYLAKGYCSLYDSPVRIMPLGDSITKGVWKRTEEEETLPPENEMVGYRLDLYEFLKNNLFRFDFIGSQQNGSAKGLLDSDHAGFGGIRDDQIYTLLSSGYLQKKNDDLIKLTDGPYLKTYQTDIILLHIGTNYPDESPDDVQKILNEIDTFSKNVTVVLARIINLSDGATVINVFNENVVKMAQHRIDQGDKIIIVDMQNEAGLNYAVDPDEPYDDGDMYDTYHPNPTGYNKMAVKWFSTLQDILPESEIPAFTSAPLTEAVKGQPYQYTSNASGLPSPTYSLVSGPEGMTVNTDSGLVEWSPDALGDFAVTLKASNWADDDHQTFTISVNALPVTEDDPVNDPAEEPSGPSSGGGGGGGCFIQTLGI